MSIKLIAIDMDGTALNSNKEITKETVIAIKEAYKHGIQVAPATGRTLSGIPKELAQLEEIRYVLYSAGAGGYDRLEDKVLFTDNLLNDSAVRIFEYMRDNNYYFDAFIEREQYTTSEFLTRLEKDKSQIKMYTRLKNSRKIMNNLGEVLKTGNVEKINSYVGVENWDKAKEYLLKDKNIHAKSLDAGWLEFNISHCNKGTGLKSMCDAINIDPSEVMGIGDNDNDIEMMEFAGVAVAMGNSIEIIKTMSDFITKTNDENGVAHAINWCINNKI